MRFVHLSVLLVVCVLFARTASSLTEAWLWIPPREATSASLPATEEPAPALDGRRLTTLLHLEERPTAPVARPKGEAPLTLLGTLAPIFACVIDQTTGSVRTVAPGDKVAGVLIVTVERGALTIRRDGVLELLATRPWPGSPPVTPPEATALVRSEVLKLAEDLPDLFQKVRAVPRFTTAASTASPSLASPGSPSSPPQGCRTAT
ncbi:MAG: hypothetical protein AMXMBFR34_44170 [Myxococcaceae bacterium]